MSFLSIMGVKAAGGLLSLIGRGGSLPGEIGLKLDPDSLKKLKFNGPVILVTGTNGKTSTANLIASTFEENGFNVITNRKGDNLKAGVVTSLLKNTDLNGNVKADVCVLEVDELNIRHILPYIPVSALVVTNFFRDQLDRAQEMETVIRSIENVLPDFKGTLILNGNDPNTVRLALKAPKAKTCYYGLKKNEYSVKQTSEASEGKFCPKCGSALEYDYYQYSHIGKFHCTKCDFSSPDLQAEVDVISLPDQTFYAEHRAFHGPYAGMYSMYNYAALIAAAKTFNLSMDSIQKVFDHAPIPFGRNEHFEYHSKPLILNLIKNPTGANEVMKVIENDPDEKNIMIVLNDHEQDGTDVSWIYDTFFEKLCDPSVKNIICSGTRANDMALRMYYSDFKGNLESIADPSKALKAILDKGAKTYVITTYTALASTRALIEKEVKES